MLDAKDIDRLKKFVALFDSANAGRADQRDRRGIRTAKAARQVDGRSVEHPGRAAALRHQPGRLMPRTGAICGQWKGVFGP
jgi:hypothetical protein